ncbi:hypothetical protein VPNG_05083 [Cytospora leucostoma]|uniref:Ribosome quality control complex subunit 1 n=1 Tax=Cytospora leucostoma TaxID=1230097 RepID=A0A423X4C4_9PEZI|nr:hypothetical protein VPNG_05083 [Cytospora leucostoma]
MSSRQLKKLHKQQELLKLQQLTGNEESSSEEEVAPPKPRASAFAGFAALGGDDEDEDVEQEDEEQEEVEIEAAPVAPAPAKKTKKSKKKKKAKKAEAASTEETAVRRKGKDELDEIDLALKELSMKPKPQTSSEQRDHGDYDANLARLLSISFDHLKVINELRAMFGQDTIDSVRNQEEVQSRDDRRRNARRGPTHTNVDLETFLKGRPGEKIPDVVLRKNPFVQGKENWPRASAGGLKMTAVTDERVEPTEFRFVHDRSYERLEMQFYSLVDMMDPMRIVHFIHENPYEVNGLIVTSKVALGDSNAALASDLLERALFTFGRVTLSSFRKKLERGVARLDFKRPENRQFWLAGYHYIKSLMQKGTYNTALEWTKLFLSLSPKDEYSMMNFTHVLAIYAYEAQWFIDLCNSSYFISDEYDLPMKEYHRQTCVLAKLQLKDREGALKDIVKGMETLPWLYSSLCSAVNIDTPRSIWGVQPRNDDDTLYSELYIHMAKDLWKREPDAIALLKEAGNIASKVDVYSLPAAQEVPLSIGRFIYLDNTPELMGLVPPKMLHASPNFDYDPLPPPRSENIFSNEWQVWPWSRTENPGDSRRGQMDNLMREAQRMVQQDRAAQNLPEQPADGAVEGDAGPAEEGEGGFLSRLAGLLLPMWMARGGRGQEEEGQEGLFDEMMREIAGEQENPWGDDFGATDEEDLPELIPANDDQWEDAGRSQDEAEEDDDEDIPPLEPAT